MARELVALMLEVPEDSFDLHVEVVGAKAMTVAQAAEYTRWEANRG